MTYGLRGRSVPSAPQTEEQWRWAEALAFQKLWGDDAPLRIAERIGVLALLGDEAGIKRLKEVAACFDSMLTEKRRHEH